MQIGFDGADEIGIYCFGKLIARIGPNEEMVQKGVSIQYLSHKEAMKKDHQNGDLKD
ncbi:hypothetical protein [Limosilactobacillus reuteri]|uniref:hypothetical protein n=1 Tax=Limosilactobacillus reuteri TaxID=1598 RepID=UPI001E4FFE83|nr:hypothetical protein [Limosilactobacillus reuteri]MCC4501064.1 hypothetical protein [Limosilactobacillus reuteri]MCC4505285.1 hypothetical protein [Limosilactobacillus reuteri]MCC4506447.1 hypothetical protein [Limosilactobacillus reuteri]